MFHPASEFYICFSLIIIVCTVVCFAECGKCPLEGVAKPLDYDVLGSVTGSYFGLSHSYSSYLSLDYGAEHQNTVPLDDNACRRSKSFHFPSTLYGYQSEAQFLRARNLDIKRSGSGCALPKKSIRLDGNVSWSSDDDVFRSLNGVTVKCSLNFRELNLEELPTSVDGVDQISVSSRRGHLLSEKKTSFCLQNIEILKSQFSEPSSPLVNISPGKLKWVQIYLYHSSVTSLRIKNTCNESVLTVYEVFSTDMQFYPFNFSEVVLGPGQVTTVTFAYLPSRLGFSSAELVLLTSLGGFLVEANGFAVDSPHKPRPLVGFDAFLRGWLNRKLSLSDLFDEMIDLEEVTALISVFEGGGSLLVESICRKQNLGDSNKYSFSNGDNKQLEPSPHKTQSNLESVSHIIGIDDPSNRARPLPGIEKSPRLTQALLGAEADTFVREGWKAQGTLNEPCLLDTHEILFPRVPIGEYYAKSIMISNPSDQPVIAQLILNSGETIDNCKTCSHQLSSSTSSSISNDSTRASGSGFSISDITVTETFLHPHGTGTLGPILFHPSTRCEWKSSAFIKSNLSGLELLSLRGFGGSLSLVMLEGSEPVQRLNFDMNFRFPQNTSNIEKISSCCRKPLLKKLLAVNAGDFPVVVERIDVSGRKCESDGFFLHNCQVFSLESGESTELWVSYQSDFPVPVVKRELELILAAVGILVIPMRASVPRDVLSLCTRSIFWSDMKHSWAIVLTVVLISLLVHHTIHHQKTEKAIKSIETGHVKHRIITGHKARSVDSKTKITPSKNIKEVILSSSFPFKMLSDENARKFEVGKPVCLDVQPRKRKKRRSSKKSALIEVSSSQSGNSTPTSPLSRVTTQSPLETRFPSPEKMQPRESFSLEPVVSAVRVPENHNQEFPGGSQNTGSREMFTRSATFPGVTRSSPSRLAIGLHARAPGPKSHSQNAVQPVDNTRVEDDRFTYNIWDNHLSGIHLSRPNSSITLASGNIGQSSSSFFLRGPRQTLMKYSQPSSVSKFYDDG